MNISSNQVSVVIQGRIDAVHTPLCIRELRRLLPNAEFIVSTWDTADYKDINADILVLSKDPGGYPDLFVRHYTSNESRILISTQKGLEKATRPYILKIRGDMFFHNINFLEYFSRFDKRQPQYQVFKHRIIFTSYFTKTAMFSGRRCHPTPFHLSDWFAFGLAEDIRFMFDISVPEGVEYSTYFKYTEVPKFKTNLMRTSSRYAPEQYVFYKACQKKIKEISFQNHLDYNMSNIVASHNLMLNNCIILDPQMIEFSCTDERYRSWTQKFSKLPKDLLRGLYTYEKFASDYKKID